MWSIIQYLVRVKKKADILLWDSCKPCLVPHLTVLAQISKPIRQYKHHNRLLVRPSWKTDSFVLVVNANCCVVAGFVVVFAWEWLVCLESASTDMRTSKSAITGSVLPALLILWLDVCIGLLHCLNWEGSCWTWACHAIYFFNNNLGMQFAEADCFGLMRPDWWVCLKKYMLAGRPGQLLVMVTWRGMALMEEQWEKNHGCGLKRGVRSTLVCIYPHNLTRVIQGACMDQLWSSFLNHTELVCR